MEKKTLEYSKAVENGDRKEIPAAEKNGWTCCGLPQNQVEWDWRKAVAMREEDKE